MATTLPIVAAVTAIKAILEFVIRMPGIVDFADIGIVLTAGVFLTGFMLSGTMADYKESEKLPGDLACTLETIEELLMQAAAQKPGIAVAPLRASVLDATTALHGWLLKSVTSEGVFSALSKLDELLQQLEHQGGGGYASRALVELHNLRKAVTRLGVISRTGFLSAGYAILETLLVMILILVLGARFKSTLAEFILVPFVTLIYVYMLRLIRDVDDPFDYAPDGSNRGGAEVELFPLTEYRDRLKSRALTA